jgi:uncharacterized protein involved in oxidation of intracellular sulfur
MKILFILNDPPYGSERIYNALRLVQALVKQPDPVSVTIFLMADAVFAGKAGQKTPEGYYNIERMLGRALAADASILACGTCLAARGIAETELIPGIKRSSMDELAQATTVSEKVLVF